MRGSVRRQRVIDVPAGQAWDLVGRPELLHLWFPGIVDCTVDGQVRSVTTGMGLTLAEDILTNDPIQRRFQYRISGGFFREHLATVDVVELDPVDGRERCLVVYSSDAEPATMAIILGGATQRALDELARQLEAGTGPAIEALQQKGVPA